MLFLFYSYKQYEENMKMIRNWVHSGTKNPEISEREEKHRNFSRKAAEEGIVLLKNEGVLPLKCGTNIALLGIGAGKTVKGGIGSGDVNERESISIYQGIKEKEVSIVSTKWLEDYEERYHTARNLWKAKILKAAEKVDNPFDAYAENPFSFPVGRPVQEDDLKGAETVIYVVSRISGEGKDRRKTKGDYYLSESEREDLLLIDKNNIPITLLLNAGGPVELTDILEETKNIKAILNISQLGQEGGRAVANVLLGEAVPNGKLTTTWARKYEDYPSAESFSYLNGNLKTEEYLEGIYVGYRHFNHTKIQPLFPFGYGLSYTTFEMLCDAVKIEKEKVTVEISVQNTGDIFAGKEVVQVYATLPQTGLAKECLRLIGFAKTKQLRPGEKQMISVQFDQKTIACFCEERHAWVVESGDYGIWIGNSSVNLNMAAILHVSETIIIEQTEALDMEQEIPEHLKENLEISSIEDEWYKSVKEEKVPVYDFVPRLETHNFEEQMLEMEQTTEELIPLLYGNISETTSTLGAAGIKVPGSAGETTEALYDKYGIPTLVMADGPAGIRLQQKYEVDRETDSVYAIGVLGALENGFLGSQEKHENADVYYQYCTAFPVGTALAQSWNTELMEEFGTYIAEEMQEFHVNLWLAPGLNIHRNPLCGRNFEYYSEDPLVSGMIAAAVTRGVQSKEGCGVTIKHFACNNQEDNRMGVNVKVTERALREIYLRGFEIAVKSSNPVAVMSSYNLVNGVYAANNHDLCTKILRQEWGFQGVVMSDWNTTVPEDGSIPWKCSKAGNDIIMPGCKEDDENIRIAYKNGELSEEVIRKSAGRVLKMIDLLK